MPAIPTVAVLLFRDGQVLLVKNLQQSEHSEEIYGLPAGRLEEGESEVEAAVRELAEETGLHTTVHDLVALPNHYEATLQRKDGSRLYSMRVFVCKQFGGELTSSVETAPEWVRLGALNEYHLLPNVAEAINEGLKFDV